MALIFSQSSDSEMMVSSSPSITIAQITSPISVSKQILAYSQDIVYSPGPYFDQLIYKTPKLILYDNLNQDPRAINMVVKYFLRKTLQKWLSGDLIEILGYVSVSGEEVKLVNKLIDVKIKADDNKDTINKKINYLAENVITNKLILNALARYVEDNRVNWYDLPKRTNGPKEEISKAIIAELKKRMNE